MAKGTTVVPTELWVKQEKLIRQTSAYFMESDGPDRRRIEGEIIEGLIELKQIKEGRVFGR